MICQVCGSEFEQTHHLMKNCSARCRKNNAMRRYRATDKGKACERRQNLRPEAKERKREWQEANPEYQPRYRKAYYMVAQLGPAKRITSIASRMNDKQKGRFADWLLKVGHKALSNHEVDYFVTDWNSQGI